MFSFFCRRASETNLNQSGDTYRPISTDDPDDTDHSGDTEDSDDSDDSDDSNDTDRTDATFGKTKRVSRDCGFLPGDKDEEEDRLELSGNLNALQRYRIVDFYDQLEENSDTIDDLAAHSIYFIEEDLREVVQEEISIQSNISSQDKNTTTRLEYLNNRWDPAERV
ncbi:hypothetical protein N7470_005019 [Penicillium chermesinum]|nr:hypothetical protein N7470_005019 [Penicillium chermesinum]